MDEPGKPTGVPEPVERPEHSVMAGLPPEKAERIAAMRRELADLQRQLGEAQQKIASEVQAHAEDDERIEALEAKLQAQELKASGLAEEIENRRALLANLTTTADELRRDIAARDAQIEEAQRKHREASEQLATLTQERDSEREAKAKLERELEEERKLHQADTETSRGAKAKLEERESELATLSTVRDALSTERDALSTERDVLKGEIEQARKDRDTARAKARDIANQLMRFAQDLVEGDGGAPPRASDARQSDPAITMPPRPSRPPPPPPPAHAKEQIVAVIEEAPSRAGSKLLMLLGGAVIGCAATFAIVQATNRSRPATTENQQVTEPAPSALTVPPATDQPAQVEPIAEPAPAPPTVEATAEPVPAPAPPAPVAKDGVLLLPPEADGHRLFVDGKVVEVKNAKAVVACGAREIKIGSRGVAQTVDVACGGETKLTAPREP